MTPLAHGIDLVPIDRIQRMLDDHADRFLERCFTQAERDYCLSRAHPADHLAARFAAKEAILKALGTGWSAGIAWTDAEVITLPTGAPSVALHNHALRIADALGIRAWLLSLTHAGGLAMASAIALGQPPATP